MRALGYFRLGTESGLAGEPPLMELERSFLRFCQEQGYQPVATFIEMESPGQRGQPEYHRLLDYIREQGKGFQVVIVRDLDQLGASLEETLHRLLELEQLGAKVMCAGEGIADPLASALEAWSKQRAGAKVGDRVREAMRMRAMRGEGLGKPPFGYKIGVGHRFEVVPQEADTVRLIYRLYLEQNMGLRLIARHLNERGIVTRKGGRWSVVSIRDILRNRTYVGTYHRFGIRVSGSHPALVSSETFNRVQQQLSSRPRPRPRQYVKAPPFLLSGLAYCGYCDNRMIGVNRHQSWIRRRDGQRSYGHYRYYQCQSRTNQSVCQYHTRRADDLEATVVADLERQASPEGRQPRMPRYEPQAPERSQLQARLKALEHRFRRYLDQAAAGDMTHWQLRAAHQRLAEQREALEHRLSSLVTEARQQAQEREQEERLTRALSRTGRWQSLSPAERRQLLQGAIERIVVYDDRVETRLRL